MTHRAAIYALPWWVLPVVLLAIAGAARRDRLYRPPAARNLPRLPAPPVTLACGANPRGPLPSAAMPLNQPGDAMPGLELAGALDRLAAALEEQTRTLLALKTDVAAVSANLRQVEQRLAALEEKRTASPQRPKAPSPAKKRQK